MAVTALAMPSPVHRKTPLTSSQKRGFIAAYGAWTLDGMDGFIYALVLVPALTAALQVE